MYFMTVEESAMCESCLKLQRSAKVQILPTVLDKLYNVMTNSGMWMFKCSAYHTSFHVFKPTVASVHQEL